MSQIEKHGYQEIVQKHCLWGERGGLNWIWHKKFVKLVMNEDVLREENQRRKTLRPQCMESFTRRGEHAVVKVVAREADDSHCRRPCKGARFMNLFLQTIIEGNVID